MRVEQRETHLQVDRVACSGHGVCHAIAGELIPLDEWGYPIPTDVATDPATADALVRMCPAAALLRRRTE